MELFIDVGNSRIKWRWWDGEALHAGGGEHHAGALDDSLFEAMLVRPASAVRVSCVAAQRLAKELRLKLGLQLDAPIDWPQTPAAGLGLVNSYQVPHNLGIDRWLALAAAQAESGRGACVVDVGTAITVDVCDAGGQHLGGIIAPGIDTLAEALFSRTALPANQTPWPQSLGLSSGTAEAIRMGGLMQGVAVIDRAVAIAREQAPDCSLWLTGGSTAQLQPLLADRYRHEPDLVFLGLALRARAAAGG